MNSDRLMFPFSIFYMCFVFCTRLKMDRIMTPRPGCIPNNACCLYHYTPNVWFGTTGTTLTLLSAVRTQYVYNCEQYKY